MIIAMLKGAILATVLCILTILVFNVRSAGSAVLVGTICGVICTEFALIIHRKRQR